MIRLKKEYLIMIFVLFIGTLFVLQGCSNSSPVARKLVNDNNEILENLGLEDRQLVEDDIGRYQQVGIEIEKPLGTIFVTSETFNGNLGGITGANRKCQTAAHNAGLSGTWKALISDSTQNARDMLSGVENVQLGNNIPDFRDMNGNEVASSINDLFDGAISHWVNVYETGEDIGYGFHGQGVKVWTGTSASGEAVPNQNCNDWTLSSGGTGSRGHSGEETLPQDMYHYESYHWIYDNVNGHLNCVTQMGLYCVRTL